MGARTTRREARDRIIKTFMDSLDRMIPPEESVPLRGQTFLDWEQQADALRKAVVPTLLQERAALDGNAEVTARACGRCPRCGSDRLYLDRPEHQPQKEVISPHGPVVVVKQYCRCRACGRSFSPQERDWSLPAEVPLTPQAACRLGREAAVQSFEPAARALNSDWGMDKALHPEEVRRWAEALGESAVAQRDAEVAAYERGQRPVSPPNAVPLLVIGMDGGRYQGQDQDPDTQSRWHEEKVLTVSSYLPGDGKDPEDGGRCPEKLVTTHLATAQPAKALGPLARVEAERRGFRQALEVIALGDGGNWIDPLLSKYFPVQARIIDWCHAAEHLWDCAKAVHGADTPQAAQMGERLEALLWNGRVEQVIAELSASARQLGPPAAGDTAASPRKILATNVGYFTSHQEHMNYPEYRKRGWPIGSGETEAAVKQFNKRIKGTEQFWSTTGVEAILALRALWLSQDDRWTRHWASRCAYVN